MGTEEPDYLAYLVRMWRVCSEEKVQWRISVESPHTGERQSFVGLETLFAFFRKETGAIQVHNQREDHAA